MGEKGRSRIEGRRGEEGKGAGFVRMMNHTGGGKTAENGEIWQI